MTINPIGIQSYQQTARRDNPALAPQADQARDAAAERQLTITPQGETAPSALAVRSKSGTYADSLSPEEKQALEILFSRFRDASRFGGELSQDATGRDSQALGNIIDVKV